VKRPIAAIVLFLSATGLILRFGAGSAPAPLRANRIVILKTQHQLLLLDNTNKVVRSYSIAIGRGGLEAKQRKGDHKSPEGIYVIDRHNPDSRFHRALHVSYPNSTDLERAGKLGIDPGGDIMVHGIQNGLGWIGPLHRAVDWTDGCFALTDQEIEEIYVAVPDGTPVEIRH
jgi:murein L,D-transpeptidase YafK